MGSSIRCNTAHWVTTCILALALAWPAPALTCSDTAEKDWDTCVQAMQSNLSDSEKQLLVGNLMYSNTYYANHSLILEWNTGISFLEVPYDIKSTNKDYIRDAWFKIVAIMPSVWLKNDLISPGYGQVLSAYNYWVEIPSGTEPGDCKTEFTLTENNSQLSLYLNNGYIGDSKLTSFNTAQNLSFNASLNVKATIEVKHYREYKYCCRRDENGCHKYCTVCQYENTEYRTSEVNLIDSKQAVLYKPNIEPTIRAVNRYKSTTVGLLNISNFDAFILELDNSSLSQFNYYYELNQTLAPYDVLTFRANKHIKKTINNLNVQKLNGSFKFYIPDSNRCVLIYFDHFNKWQENCSLNQTIAPIVLKTDKVQYDENETIKLTVNSSEPVTIKYGNEEYEAKGSILLKAKPNTNRIVAQYDNLEAYAIIHVKRKGTWEFALNFSVFSAVLYSLYLLIKKYVFWM